MDRKVCLDTDAAIDIISGDEKVDRLVAMLPGCEACISSVTAFELLLRATNVDIAKRFINTSEILPFGCRDAIKASAIFKELKKKGQMIDFRDVFIAASCIVNDCSLATFNKKHFERIKELKLLSYD